MHKEALSSTTDAAVAVAAATAVENGGVSATKRSGGGGSFLTNAMTSIKRYYNNNFSDHGKQHAMNVFLGHFIPDAVKSNIWELDAGAVRCDADLAYGAAVGSLTRALALAQTQQLRAVRRIVNIDRSRQVAPAPATKTKRTSLLSSAVALLPQIAEDDDQTATAEPVLVLAEIGGGSAADATAASADTSTDVSAAEKSGAATRARFLDSHSWLRDEFRDYFEERYAPADLTSFDDELALPHNRVVAVRKVLIGGGSPASGNVVSAAAAMMPSRFSLALASEQPGLAADSDGKNASTSTSTSSSTSATSSSSSNVPLTTIAEESGVASPMLSSSSSSPSTIPLSSSSSSSSALPVLPPLSNLALDGAAYSIFAPRQNGGSSNSSGANGSKNLLVSNRTAHSAAAAPHAASSSASFSGMSTSAATYANYIALASSHTETAFALPSSTDYSHYCDAFAFAAPIARAALEANASDVALVQYATAAERSLAELPSTLSLSSSAASTAAASASSALQSQRRAEVRQLRDLTRARLARLDSLAAHLDSGGGLGLDNDNILGALGDVDPASSNYFASAAPVIVGSSASVASATAAAAAFPSASSSAPIVGSAATMGRAAAALSATLSLSGEPFLVSTPASSSSAGGLGADSMMPLSYFPRHRKSIAPSTPTALPSAPVEASATESPAKSGGFFTSLTSLFSTSK
jgi:hypothetical protein